MKKKSIDEHIHKIDAEYQRHGISAIQNLSARELGFLGIFKTNQADAAAARLEAHGTPDRSLSEQLSEAVRQRKEVAALFLERAKEELGPQFAEPEVPEPEIEL